MLTVVPDLPAALPADGRPSSLIDQIVREGARQMLAAALQAEVDDYIRRFSDVRDVNGRRMVVRNGTAEPRTVLTSAAAVEVTAPRVNDKRTDPATGERMRHADLSRRYPRPPKVDSTAPVTRAPEPPVPEPAAAPERAPARRPAARPARARAPRRERAASRPPRVTPAIIRDGRYELVKAPDRAESRAWHVMIGRRRAGLVRPAWQGGETGRAWEAVDLSGEVLPVTGTGKVTRAGNARNRDAAAISPLSALLRQQGQR